jgi:hypothetical protein
MGQRWPGEETQQNEARMIDTNEYRILVIQLLRFILLFIWRPQKSQWDIDTQEEVEELLATAYIHGYKHKNE